MIKNHKVIATTFAGRQDRMSISIQYIIKAIEKGIVDEYHIWDFTKTESDKAWLQTVPQLNDKIKLFTNHYYEYGEYRQDLHWYPYYSHYTLDNYTEETVVIKMDDDIVYMDLDGLERFVTFRIDNPQYFLVYGNVVNNGASTGLQQQYGAIPKDICPPDGFPYETYCGILWHSGELAKNLHLYFIDNMEKFKHEGFFEVPIGDRVSINFISFLGKDFHLTKTCFCDDERKLSLEMPQIIERGNVIFYPMLAAHLSFYSQEHTGVDPKMLIEKYENILKNI